MSGRVRGSLVERLDVSTRTGPAIRTTGAVCISAGCATAAGGAGAASGGGSGARTALGARAGSGSGSSSRTAEGFRIRIGGGSSAWAGVGSGAKGGGEGEGGSGGCVCGARRRSEVVLIVCGALTTGRVGCMSSPSVPRIWRAACGRSMSERTFSVSSRSGKGLSRKASAPAPTTARMRASERTADSAMNGTASSPGTARSARSRLSPSMSGIRMSLTTQSGLICPTFSSAALPVGNEWVSNSGARNARSSSRRTFGSSSTTIIRRGVVISWLASARDSHAILSEARTGCQRAARAPRLSWERMFIVAWEGTPPPDKHEWTAILREVLAGELGSYRVLFRRGGRGWRFELEWRDDGRSGDADLVANSPDSVGYNIYVNLAGSGKPLDPGWRPLRPGEAPRAESSSPAAPPTRPAAGKRTKRGR